jgi:hypothetical protein
MKIVVRFTVDACLPTSTDSSAPMRSTASVNDLADALGGMSIKRPTPASTNTASSSSIIDIVRAGTQVSQEALVEMTSRSAYFLAQFDWNELYPQLVLSQTPALHLGVHERGVFTQLYEWQLNGQAHTRTGTTTGGAKAGATPPDISAEWRETGVQIMRLARLLEDVQELAIAQGPGAAGSFSLVCENGELRVYARKDAKSCLPPDVVARFEVPKRI